MKYNSSVPMRFFLVAGFITVFALLSGCSLTTPEIMHYKPSAHTYRFSVMDGDGKAIAGASVSATLYNQTSRVRDTVVTTDQDGKITLLLNASADTTDQYQNAFDTRCEYTVSAGGFLPEFGTQQIRYVLTDLNQRGDKGLNESSAEVVLKKVENIADASFQTVIDPALKASLLTVLTQIHHEVAVKGMTLPPHSAGISGLEGASVFHVVINTGNVLNTDALTEDKMVQALFELAGRPSFEAIRNNLEQLGTVKGFSLVLHAKKKSFSNKSGESTPIECKYVVNREVFEHVDSEAPDIKFLGETSISMNGVDYHVQK